MTKSTRTTAAKTTAKKTATSKAKSTRKSSKPATVSGVSIEDVIEVTAIARADTASTKSDETSTNDSFKKSDLIDKIVERSGMKKKTVKPIVEATLAVLGEVMKENQELNLEPFGKVKLNRVKETQNARISVLKLRQSNAPVVQMLASDDDSLDQAAE